MEPDLNIAKQYIMYTNDSVEATFTDGSKIYLAPCATEYVVQQSNHAQSLATTKHRTIYTTSELLPRIRCILKFRNLYAQQPFLVPSLVESNQCFQSTNTATHVRWSPNISLPTISNDDPTQTWSWISLCGKARIDIPQCRQIVYVTHPLQVSRIPTKHDNDIPTKYIHIFAPIRRCFSCQRLPDYLSKFVNKCLQLIEHLSNNQNLSNIKTNFDDEWCFQLPSPLPSSSCPKAYRHRLHHEMKYEADIHVLQTKLITYRIEYDNPITMEAFLFDETVEHLTDYINTADVQSSFYNYYSIKEKQCQLLTLSERALPPQNERLLQIVRFMSTMRENILSMTRRIQERPCWMSDDDILSLDVNVNDTFEQSKISSLENDIEDEEQIYRQNLIDDVGHFKYYIDNHVQIKFFNGFILNVTCEQVQSYQNNLSNFQCQIIDRKRERTIDIIDGIMEPGCYEQYITAAIEWCEWVWNEKRLEEQKNLAKNFQQELFNLKLYRNMIEINEYQQSPIINSSSKKEIEYYSPNDIKKVLDQAAKFTKEHTSK